MTSSPKKAKRWKVPAALVLGGGISVALGFILMQEKGREGTSRTKGNEDPLEKGLDHPVTTMQETEITKKEDKPKLLPLIIKPIIDPLIPKP